MLKALLEKLAKGLAITSEEKAYLVSKSEELTDDQNEAVETAEVVDEVDGDAGEDDGDEALDEKGLASIIRAEVAKAVANTSASMTPDEKAKEIANDIAEKRAKGSNAGVKSEKNVKADAKTRDFIKAVVENDKVALKAMSTAETGTSKAGYTVPEELEAEVQRLIQDQYGIARQEMKYMPMSGAGNTRKITTGGALSVYWTDEEGDITSTQATFGRVTQILKKLSAIVPLTEEVIEDSAINLTAYVAELFAEAIAKAEDDQFFDGDGTVWTGLLRNTDIANVDLATGDLPADITLEKLQEAIDATATPALRNAKWYMEKSVLGKIKVIKDGSGNYVFPELLAGRTNELLTYPIVLTDSCPASSITDTTRGFILFGDLSRGAVYGDKGGMKVKTSSEATIRNVADTADINLFEQDMVALRVARRVGYVVTVASYMTKIRTGA